jgi:hypothetical protein
MCDITLLVNNRDMRDAGKRRRESSGITDGRMDLRTCVGNKQNIGDDRTLLNNEAQGGFDNNSMKADAVPKKTHANGGGNVRSKTSGLGREWKSETCGDDEKTA